MKAPLFLKAKHWQIFVPTVGIPFVTMIVFVFVMISNISMEHSRNPNEFFAMFKIMPILAILCVATQFLWMWNIGVNLRKYILTPERKTRLNLFRFTFFFPIFYMSLMPMLVIGMMSSSFSGHGMINPGQFVAIFLLMLLGHFTTMFCVLNNNYVVAKTIKMAELQRKVTFGDFVGDFFFLLIFPVAIWFLQPRINRIVNGEVGDAKVGFVGSSEKDLLDF